MLNCNYELPRCKILVNTTTIIGKIKSRTITLENCVNYVETVKTGVKRPTLWENKFSSCTYFKLSV